MKISFHNLNHIKLALLFVYLIFTLLFYVVLSKYYEEEANKRILQILHFNKSIQHYVSTVQKPLINKLIADNKLDKAFFDPAITSSTYVANHINANYIDIMNKSTNNSSFVKIKFASDNPLNLNNTANSFEKSILQRVRDENLSSIRMHVKLKDENYFFYAIPYEQNSQSCLECHGDPSDAPVNLVKRYGIKSGFHEEKGDLRAIIAMYTPIDEEQNAASTFFFIVELTAFVLLLAIYLIIKRYALAIKNQEDTINKQTRFAALGEMITMIAHQWRQPLTGMGMTIDNILLDIELSTLNEDKLKSNCESISTQIHYLSHTIDDFKNFFKANHPPQRIVFTKLVEESIQIIESTLKQNRVTISVIDPDHIEFESYRNDWIQILLNLIKNAMDAYISNNIDQREITVSTTSNETGFIITITDNAGGISPMIIDKIFDPYFSTKDEKNGTGLGLYMIKMIIRDHFQGNITASSSNASTVFTITIPATIKKEINGN